MNENEKRYEAIELVVKSRDDGQSWFDVLFDMFTEGCTGDDVENCTCSMVHMGGSGGTEEQCHDWLTTVGQKLQPIHLARAIKNMAVKLEQANIAISEDVQGVVEWAEHEIRFEEYFENKEWEQEEDGTD